MPTTLADFNLTTSHLRAEFGLDINADTIPEDYTDNLEYINVLETVGDVSGLKRMEMNAELFVPDPTVRFTKSGVATYASVKTSTDNWATEWEESIFTGSTSRNNSIPINDVKLRGTTQNDDFLDRKASRQIFEDEDVATIIESLLLEVGVPALNIDLSPTGRVIPLYHISNNFRIRFYIEDLAKSALLVVGFNREGKFSSNTILKNDFDGSFPTPDVTITQSDIIKFSNREIRSNMYYNDITVRGYGLEKLTDTQLYFNAELSGYEIKAGQTLFFEIELDDLYPTEIYPMVARNSGVNLLSTFGFRFNSYYECFTADSGGTVNNVSITMNSFSIIPSDTEGQDKILIKFSNAGGSSRFLKQIILNGSAVQRLPLIESSIVDNAQIIEDGKRISLIYESRAIYNDVVAGEILAILKINLAEYANVYVLEMHGRPQLEVGSVLGFQNRNGDDVVGTIYEIDSELSRDKGYTQILTIRTLANLSSYLALDDAGRGLDEIDYQLL